MRALCIQSLTIMQGIWNLHYGRARAMPEIKKAKKYGELRGRETEDVGRAVFHEKERMGERKVEGELAGYFYRHGSRF